jgi:hypothetical protein
LIAKTKSEGRYLVRLSLKLNVFNITFPLKELGTVMMRLNEFPTEDELKVMVAEVDQVGAIEEKNRIVPSSMGATVHKLDRKYQP